MKSNVFICLVRNIDRLEIIDGKWFGGNSFQKYEFENIQETSQFEIGLKFRTTDGNGVLLFVGNAEKSLSLMMYNGVLELVLGTEKINDLTIVDETRLLGFVINQDLKIRTNTQFMVKQDARM